MTPPSPGRHRADEARGRHRSSHARDLLPRLRRSRDRRASRPSRWRLLPVAAVAALAGGMVVVPTASAAPSCDGSAPGASSGANQRGAVTFDGDTATVSNTVFDASHADDLVRVYDGHVVFDHVTFRGNGTGGSGHTLEVKQGGSVEVYNSVFAGSPSEDTVQFHEHAGTSTIACSAFRSAPGEDHLDFKPSNGAVVNVRDNAFPAGTPGGRTVQNAGSGGTQNFVGNSGMGNVFYEEGSTGRVRNNAIAQLDLYDVSGVDVVANTLGGVKHGEGSGDRDPTGVTYVNNEIGEFAFNGGSCAASGNTGDALRECSDAPAQDTGDPGPGSSPTSAATATPTSRPAGDGTPTGNAEPTVAATAEPTREPTTEPTTEGTATTEPTATGTPTGTRSPSGTAGPTGVASSTSEATPQESPATCGDGERARHGDRAHGDRTRADDRRGHGWAHGLMGLWRPWR